MSMPPPIPPVSSTPKKGLSTGCIVGLVVGIIGFFVVAIVAVLAALAVPAVSGVMKKAKLARTQATLKDLELAVKNYQVEYDRYPIGWGESDNESSGPMLQVLLGKDASGLNPRQIVFLDLSMSTSGKGGLTGAAGSQALVDLWGEMFHLTIDADSDGKVPDPEHPGATLEKAVIIWSAGEDGNPTTWGDNVMNWK